MSVVLHKLLGQKLVTHQDVILELSLYSKFFSQLKQINFLISILVVWCPLHAVDKVKWHKISKCSDFSSYTNLNLTLLIFVYQSWIVWGFLSKTWTQRQRWQKTKLICKFNLGKQTSWRTQHIGKQYKKDRNTPGTLLVVVFVSTPQRLLRWL